MKKAIYRVIGLAILAAAGWGGYRAVKQLPARQDSVPTAKVQRSDVVIRAFTRGELHAVRSVTLNAPNLNGTVQVTRLAPVGALAREKDLIVEYDDSERLAALEEAQLSVQSVDEQIKKAKADLAIQQSQDQVTLLKTRYDVRRADLEVQRNPIIDAIDAKKNILSQQQSRKALEQLEADIQARQEQADSQLAVLREQRNRSLIDVSRELMRIANTKSLALITGLVSIKQNRAGYFNFGQQLPDIREGDTLQPGMPVADLLDLSELEVWTKVGELDRANLKEGQDALVQLDAIPDKQFRGQIKAMSGTASTDVFSGDPSKKFDVVFSLDMRQLLAGLGMKPADIEQIMATAAANAKKNVVNTAPSFFAGLQGSMPGAPGSANAIPGMAGAMGAAAGMPGVAGMQEQAVASQDNQDPGGGRGNRGTRGSRGGGDAATGGGNRGGGAMAGLSDEDRQKLRKAMTGATAGKDPSQITPEDRQKMMQDLMAKLGIKAGAAGAGAGRSGSAEGGPRGEGGRGGAAAGGTPAGMGGVNPLDLVRRAGGSSPFTEEERNGARLPLPPEQDSQVQALLRPGLLADVEIVVEKIPNALHVPAQAVFQKGGKFTVFVRQKNGKFEPREVQLVKQSESLMVLASGVQAGEVIALADPTADKSDKKNKSDRKSAGGNGNPMGGMAGGK
ncbi:MAG: efflux RND transporter periplasmic adaptor subunit [Acidobacteriia bacterium]|nr:efflux RND transporter periplasmic adaptor subunit [Terriglobia bacterium]